MKKVDLHIHTISTVKDHHFDFDMDSLVRDSRKLVQTNLTI